MDHIEFTPELAKELEGLYKKAVAEHKDQFVFKGRDVLTAYAKYMLEYLHTKMKF